MQHIFYLHVHIFFWVINIGDFTRQMSLYCCGISIINNGLRYWQALDQRQSRFCNRTTDDSMSYFNLTQWQWNEHQIKSNKIRSCTNNLTKNTINTNKLNTIRG